jgi:hypothetical protein
MTSDADDGGGPSGGVPADPSPAEQEGQPPPLHPSVQPQGESVAWSAMGSLLSGPIVWGGVGYLLDHLFGTGRVFTAIGVVVGSLTAFYIVYLRFGRDQ